MFRSGIVIPWITIIATGIYIAAAGKLVTEGAKIFGWSIGWFLEEDGLDISNQNNLGGGFKYCLFSPLFGEDFHVD